MAAVAAPTVELNVTENAAVEIKKFLATEEDLPETAGLRVRVVPGGCSGFQYKLSWDEAKTDDHVFENSVVTDGISLPFLDGSTVDFISGLIGEDFKVSNPNAKSGCGCGTSFAV